jgi:hypothetical protein
VIFGTGGSPETLPSRNAKVPIASSAPVADPVAIFQPSLLWRDPPPRSWAGASADHGTVL